MFKFTKDNHIKCDVVFDTVSNELLKSVMDRHHVLKSNLAGKRDYVNKFLVFESGMAFITLVSKHVILHELVGFSCKETAYYVTGVVSTDMFVTCSMRDKSGTAVARDCISVLDSPAKLEELHKAMLDLKKFGARDTGRGFVNKEILQNVPGVRVDGRSIFTDCGIGVFRPYFYNSEHMIRRYAEHSIYGLLESKFGTLGEDASGK